MTPLPRRDLGAEYREPERTSSSGSKARFPVPANWLWVIVLGVASSAWCVTAAARVGVTFDEPFYVKAGLARWRTGSPYMLMRAGTMTLPVDVQTLPIHVWELLAGRKYATDDDLPRVLPAARAANLVFWWLLLVYSFRLGRTFGGDWGGRLASALAATDPNLLGHASLATTDIACTATFLMLVFHYWHSCGVRSAECEVRNGESVAGWKRRVLLPGVCYALAIQAKVSGLVFGMEAMILMGIWRFAESGRLTSAPGSSWKEKFIHFWHACYPLRRDIASATAIALSLVFVYTGTDWKPDSNFVKWADALPEGRVKAIAAPLSHHLAVFPNAAVGLLYQFTHNVQGHDTFLLGHWYAHPTPAYFPLALAMKLPAAVLVLLGVALWTHPRRFVTPIAAIALLLLVLSVNYRVQIGIRFMFPMIALTYVALATAIARGWSGLGNSGEQSLRFTSPSPQTGCCSGERERLARSGHEDEDAASDNAAECRPPHPGPHHASGRDGRAPQNAAAPRPLAWLTAATIATTAVAAISVWPRGICYFNPLWGGTEEGATLLHDSNYDWGQGLPELREWCREHDEERIAVWYYGLDPAVNHAPFDHVSLDQQPHGGDSLRIRSACGNHRYLAVSVGCFDLDEDITPNFRASIEWVRARTPVARTTCFYIYGLEPQTIPSRYTPPAWRIKLRGK